MFQYNMSMSLFTLVSTPNPVAVWQQFMRSLGQKFVIRWPRLSLY